MRRDRLLILIAIPIVVGAVLLIIREYRVFNDAASSAAPQSSPDTSGVPAPGANIAPMPGGVAYEELPPGRTAEETAVINHAKDAPASMLESSLPHQSAGDWIAHAAGEEARIRWEANNCPGSDMPSGESHPVCAQATIRFQNGTRFQTLLLLGDRSATAPAEVHYSQPSLLWAAYQRGRGALTPASLSLLPKIAAESR